MQGLPHEYAATATSSGESLVTAGIQGQPDLSIAPPASFGGPGDIHSPEDLQVAAVASCFILSFKAIARASKLEWKDLKVTATGTLDQVDRQVLFTEFRTRAELTLAAGADPDKAARLLEKAKQSCFITNSLKGNTELEVVVRGGE